MDISYNWLKDLIDTGLDAETTARELTRVGLAVEGVHPQNDDWILDVDLTSNRPDCLSHLGVARELSVITKAKIQAVASVPSDEKNPSKATDRVSISDPDLCHRFTARIVRGVKIGPSPQWLVDRLEALGERSINNVADITNYVMLELGQPMHAFDLDKLAEGRILVRRAISGESITTLKEEEKVLGPDVLAICDAEKPVAIGGVIGGLDSSITDFTVNVLLEVAYFDRANIRATSRKLNIATEASYRFERGVDIQNLVRASNRAAKLIVELAGGELGEFVDVDPTGFTPKKVESSDISAAVGRLTGLDVPTDECVRILGSLGIQPIEGSHVFVAPSWRHDIAIEEDLVEEIARHAGYENIASELPPSYGAGEYQVTEHREKLLRQRLVDMGFDEAISYSFVDTRHDEIFQTAPGVIDENADEQFVTLQDSVIEGAVRMRATILPGLLDAVRLNRNFQRRDLKLFEVGKVFSAGNDEDGLPNEHEMLTLVITGSEVYQNKALATRQLDFYDAKGSVEAALDAIGITDPAFSSAEVKHLRNGQAASIAAGGTDIGSVGRLDDEIAATYKFRDPVYVAEIDLGAALAVAETPLAYAPLAKFPGVTRDITFAASKNVSYASIRAAAVGLGVELCRDVQFADVFEGKGLADNERALTIRLLYRSDERTLVEDEVEAIHKKIVEEIERVTGVKQRV
ncbi:MAG: phenylalanine--tRNA ligase subunit beta [Pyrinomonadaceae bacterium]